MPQANAKEKTSVTQHITTKKSLMYQTQKGFTLIELLIVITIAAVMAVIALPNMSEWIASRRAASQAEQVANLLRFARAEAVRLNLPVYVCPVKVRKNGLADGKCDSSQKSSGLLAYADKNRDKAYENDTSDISLRSIVLNDTDPAKVFHTFQHVAFGKDNADDGEAVFWSFMPNGTFGYTTSKTLDKSTTFKYSDGYIKISMTDKAATTEETKKSRASIVLIDSSGRVEICAKSDSRPLCQYSESQSPEPKK